VRPLEWEYSRRPYRLWNHARPPEVEEVPWPLIGLLKAVGERTWVRGVLQLCDVHLARVFVDPNNILHAEFSVRVPDRVNSQPLPLVIGYTSTAPTTREEVQKFYHDAMKFFATHESAEGLWDGDPENDPHRMM
jgi:hypothetical protein